MSDIVVMVPTYMKSYNVYTLVESWANTSSGLSDLYLRMEYDDPTIREYQEAVESVREDLGLSTDMFLPVWDRDGWLGIALNRGWRELSKVRPTTKVWGFLGDDHRFRTNGWEERVLEEIGQGGVAYGNDLLRGEELATAAFLSSDIPQRLGHFVLPGLRHMYMDNYWMDVGRAYGNLVYMPDVIIEHMHFENGKANVDEGYMRAAQQGFRDEQVYSSWHGEGGFQKLLETFGRTV